MVKSCHFWILKVKKGEIWHLLSSIVMCLVYHARKYLVLFTEDFVLSCVSCFILIFVHGA